MQSDGVHYDDLFKEYVIVVGGEAIGYDASQANAYSRYHLALATRREHSARCPMDTVL